MLSEQANLSKRRKITHLDPAFERHSFNERRAALSLAQLAERQEEVDVSANGVAKLIYALHAQADSDHLSDDTAPLFNIDPSDRSQRDELLKVRRLIDIALANGKTAIPISEAMVNGVSTPKPLVDDEPLRFLDGPCRPSTVTASSQQVARPSKPRHLNIPMSDEIEVRSDGGFEPRSRLSGVSDEREAQSAPNSRPSSRRETRRASRRSAANQK